MSDKGTKDLYWSILVWSHQFDEYLFTVCTTTYEDDFGNFIQFRVWCSSKRANRIDFVIDMKGQVWADVERGSEFYKFNLKKQEWKKVGK